MEFPSLSELFIKADAARREAVGDIVHLRGLIEFSNNCRCNCLYCGLRRDNCAITRYRMEDAEIIAAAKDAASDGADTIVLQSGEDPFYHRDHIATLVGRIKDETGLAVTLSVGDRSTQSYRLWKQAGADRYLLKHETSDPELYARMHPGESLEKRLNALQRLRSLDYETGTGFIIGLPGQTLETIHNDIRLVAEIEARMCGVGPFIPQHDTPMGNEPSGDIETTLYTVAMLRISSPHLNLPATTALASLVPEQGHQLALKAGANVIMPSYTPLKYSENYTIYDSKTRVEMELAKQHIAMAGRRCSREV